MGKGRILSGGTDGLYQIEILEDRTRAEAARTTAVHRVASLDTRLAEMTADLAAAQNEVDAAAAAQDQAIADYQAALADPQLDAEDARQAMVKAGEAVIHAAAKRDAIARNIRALKSERLALQRRIDLIDGLPPLRQQSAWCADYTDNLSGDVATAEVPGEIGKVIIQPAYDGAEVSGWPSGVQGGAAWSPAVDGAIQPALSGTPASAFYNLAMMPGWQRWRPTFRIGTISNLAADLCDITLDAATSSQQGLNVNAQDSYSGVPIYYMECNGGVFENGDRVLVAFSGNTDQPMVVGFESDPRPCGPVIDQVVDLYPLIPTPFLTQHSYAIENDDCSGAYILTRDLNPDDLILSIGVYSNSVIVLTNAGPRVRTSSMSGDSWTVEGTATAVVKDYAATLSGISGTYEETTWVELNEGDPLTATCSVLVSHSTVCSTSPVCRARNATDPPEAPLLYGVLSSFTEVSTITVDNDVFDLSTLGLRIAGASMKITLTEGNTDPVTYTSIWGRRLEDIQSDEHKLKIQKDYRGVVYVEAHMSTLDRGIIHVSPSAYQSAISVRVAAFMKAPDGEIFRVKAKDTADQNQLPDHASLPSDIEEDGLGGWVAV